LHGIECIKRVRGCDEEHLAIDDLRAGSEDMSSLIEVALVKITRPAALKESAIKCLYTRAAQQRWLGVRQTEQPGEWWQLR
jgi:hypothetical protein